MCTYKFTKDYNVNSDRWQAALESAIKLSQMTMQTSTSLFELITIQVVENQDRIISSRLEQKITVFWVVIAKVLIVERLEIDVENMFPHVSCETWFWLCFVMGNVLFVNVISHLDDTRFLNVCPAGISVDLQSDQYKQIAQDVTYIIRRGVENKTFLNVQWVWTCQYPQNDCCCICTYDKKWICKTFKCCMHVLLLM